MTKYFTREHLERSRVADHPLNHGLRLGQLKEMIDKQINDGVPLDTLVAIEHVEDEYFEKIGNGWTIIDYLWDVYRMTPESELAYCYSRSIPAFQLIKSKDEAGDTILVITPHY